MAAEVVPMDYQLHRQIPAFSKWVDQLALTANTAASYTVATGVNSVIVKYTAGTLFYRADGGTAVIPAAGKTDGTGSAMVLQGEPFACSPGQVVSFINGTDCYVTFEGRSGSRL